jgi:PIN domain nuclease of toxin-antitoxin system
MMTAPTSLLLDTCAVLWLAGAQPMRTDAMTQLEGARQTASIYVSPISAWELGTLTQPRGSRRPRLELFMSLAEWFSRFMAQPGLRDAPFTAEIAIAAASLPSWHHQDPGDRLLVATARHSGLAIVTRDDKILDYAQAGHVSAIPC